MGRLAGADGAHDAACQRVLAPSRFRVSLRGAHPNAMFDHFVRQRGAWMSTIVAVAVSLHVLVGLFPLWLTGRVPGLPWSIVGLLVAYGCVAQVVAWFVRHSDYWPVALLL